MFVYGAPAGERCPDLAFRLILKHDMAEGLEVGAHVLTVWSKGHPPIGLYVQEEQ